jgi:hypothetical protein
MYGSCPALLLEPQRTNLALQSDGVLSTYATNTNVTNASSSFNSFTNAIQFPSTGLSLAYKSISTTTQIYCISVFIKMDDNSVPVLSSSAFSGNVSLVIGGAVVTNNLLVDSYGNNVYRLSGTATSSGLNLNNGVVRYDTQVLKSFKITAIQLEAGAYPTTYIPTTTASATRVADSFTRNNIYTNGLITSSGGTWFVELLNNIAYQRDASGSELYIGEDATSGLVATKKAILIRNSVGTGLALLNVTFWNGTSLSSIYGTTTSTVKLAIKFDGTTADIFANGTKVVTSASVALTLANMQHLNALSGVPRFISQMDLFPTPLTDAECIALTTL